ncbi:MAG: hypothetical protein JSW55_11300 [Chloroflexota bacterium]|nr:MAG: hypothetical protein JSW55_11300 [Chloroflexota bacterium]
MSQSVSGLVEAWTKWRFPLAAPEFASIDAGSGASAWLAIDKERQLRRYQISEDQQIQPVRPETTISDGCELELTRLRASEGIWWTVAFEAFGESAGNHKRLVTTAGILLAESRLRELAQASSYGYPHLLSGLAGVR